MLTDTPVKKALQQAQKAAKEKKQKGSKNKKLFSIKEAGPSNSKTRRIFARKPVKEKCNKKNKDGNEEDVLCLSCFKPFSNSLQGAVWKQCSSCQRWAHVSCVEKDAKGLDYKCLYCC
ncbi:uncharacterized protein LOC136075094 [Hydra vulgaris]|uniref:Uncharacterized protein LOC136075094 n=1 Tax=Hydra vulgaris TaxID=6087 RepID=A0ABM4B3M6_HYDVU